MRHERETWPVAHAMATAVVAAAAASMAVATQPGAQTFLLGAVGLLYLVVPPSGRIPRMLAGGAFLILLLAAAPLLPASWIGSPFRPAFIDHGFVLPETASMQPWWTLEDLTLLLVTLLWGWNCLGNKLTPGQRQFLQAAYTLLLGAVAVLILFHQKMADFNLPGWIRDAGQFANRNQTGDLLVMGGVSAAFLGIDLLSREKLRAAGWIALTFLFVLAAIGNGSRAGLLLLAAGLATACIWDNRERVKMGWKAALVVLAIIGVLLLLAGGPLRDRIGDDFKSGHASRLLIYEDAASLITQGSWHGIGLGNFEGVFNTTRTQTRGDMSRNLHPESDWLWIGIELGWAGLLAVVAMVVVAFRVFLAGRPVSPMEKTAWVIAILFLFHSLIDVGAHRMGTMWTCLYLVGLGASKARSLNFWPTPRPVLRLLGVLLLVVAGLRIQAMSRLPWMPIRGSLEAAERFLDRSPCLPQQKAVLDRALGWTPLDWKLYWQRSIWSIRAHQPLEESQVDFDRALYLDQSSIGLPLAIGEVYRQFNFERAMPVWRDALARAGDRREEIYRNLLLNSGLDTKSRLELTTLAGDDPNLRLIAVLYQDASEFDRERLHLLESDPDLEDVRPQLLAKFLERWVEVGDVGDYLRQWPLHPRWQASGWRPYAQAMARIGQYGNAVDTALAHLPAAVPPKTKLTLGDAKDQYRNLPQDPWAGLQVYAAEVAAGLDEEALQTLEGVAKLPGAPPSFACLLAGNLMEAGRSEEAWKALASLLARS